MSVNDRVDAGANNGGDPSATDPRASPCEDFYAYACGGFEARAQIGAADGATWRTFTPLHERNDAIVRDLLETWESHAGAHDATEDLVGDFYAACMDVDAIEAEGDAELRSLVASVSTSTPDGIAHAQAMVHWLGGDGLFSFTPEIDPIDGFAWIALVRQPELDLSPEEYGDANAVGRLRVRIAAAFELAGEDRARAERDAADVTALEASLAGATESRAVFRDPKRGLAIVGAGNLAALQPHFDWSAYYTTIGMGPPVFVHVATPAYFTSPALARALASPSLAAFFRWEILHALEPAARAAFRRLANDARRARTGALADAPRSVTCAHLAETFFGGALDRPFAERAATHEDLERAGAVANHLVEALQARLERWNASPAAHERALLKTKALRIELGAGARTVDLPRAPIDRQHFMRDFVSVSSWRKILELDRIGRRAGIHDWSLAATDANAELDVRRNRIQIAAGLLASPLTGARSSAAELGTLGVVVGHELAHAFDERGWRYDALGLLDPAGVVGTGGAPLAIAPALASELRDVSVSGVPLRVPRVLDETAADVVGLALAHDALAARPLADGESVKERDRAFFMAYAQLWCARFRPEALVDYTEHDAHPPPHVRVDEAVSHRPELAAAFDCPNGPMVRAPLP